jgi:hypothetical protein
MSSFNSLKRNRDRAAAQEVGGLVPIAGLVTEPDTHELVPLASLRLDGGTQPRVSMDTELIAEYAERMVWDEARGAIVDPEGKPWEAITVYQDGEGECWLADGFHRAEAARRAGHERIQADVRAGRLEDAFVFSLGANQAHGKRRTNKDKKRAVLQALRREFTQARSDTWLAEICKVSQPSVSKYRRELERAAEIPFIEQLETADESLTAPRKPPGGFRVGEGGFLEPEPGVEPTSAEVEERAGAGARRAGAGASAGFEDLEVPRADAIVAFPLSRADCKQLASAMSQDLTPRLLVVPIEPDSPMAYEAPRVLACLVDDHGFRGPTPVYITSHDRFYFVWAQGETDSGVLKDSEALLSGLEVAFLGQPLGGWST